MSNKILLCDRFQTNFTSQGDGEKFSMLSLILSGLWTQSFVISNFSKLWSQMK